MTCSGKMTSKNRIINGPRQQDNELAKNVGLEKPSESVPPPQECLESVLSQDALAARCDRTIRLGPNPQVFRHHFRSFSRLSLSLQRAAETVE